MSFRITSPRITTLIAVAITNLIDRPAPVVEPVSEAGSPLRRLERAAAMARAHFADGHRKGIISIVAEILDVSPEDKAKVLASLNDDTRPGTCPWKIGDIVIPLTNNNSHSYPLNEAIICFGGDFFLYIKGDQFEKGNSLDRRPGAWRFATREEIDSFDIKLRDILAGKVQPGEDDKLLAAMGLLPKPVVETLAQA